MNGKSLLHPLEGGLLNLINYKTVYSTPELSKTGQINPQTVLNGGICYINRGLLQYQRFCLFLFFLFISAEPLKNHSKSQKNHKMKNLILLDST
jgi:hypothetical protein